MTHLEATPSLLEGAEEALVLGYHLDESTAQFEFVCDFWGKSVAAHRAFVLFRFSGVQQFKRKPGARKALQRATTTFVLRDVTGAWVVQYVETGKVDTLSRISFSMGETFGGIEFCYENVTYEVIQLYAKQKGPKDWAYFEVESDRPVDFYNPFERSWAEVR